MWSARLDMNSEKDARKVLNLESSSMFLIPVSPTLLPSQKPSVTWSVRKALQCDLVVWARTGGLRARRHLLD